MTNRLVLNYCSIIHKIQTSTLKIIRTDSVRRYLLILYRYFKYQRSLADKLGMNIIAGMIVHKGILNKI